MRARRLLPILSVLCTATVLHAEAVPGARVAAAQPPSGALSTAEITSGAASMSAQLEKDTRIVMRLRDVARKKNDVIKLTCVNERLVEIKARRNIADAQNQDLQVALTTNSSAATTSSLYARMVETSEAVRRLREDANACFGTPELSSASGSEFQGPQIDDNPIANNPFNPPTSINMEPPVYASPFY